MFIKIKAKQKQKLIKSNTFAATNLAAFLRKSEGII